MCFDRPVTVVALKRLGAGVFAVVPRQLVAPGESPLAALPRALVRLLTWGTEYKEKHTHKHLFPPHRSSTNHTLYSPARFCGHDNSNKTETKHLVH